LKSLHDSSYVNCKKCTIYVDEEFLQSNILDSKDILHNIPDAKFKPLVDDMDFVLS
jgi:hypothetical protein